MTHFHSSTSIGQSRRTNKQFIVAPPTLDTPISLTNPANRRRRNLRKVREEKVLLNPLPPVAVTMETDESDSESSSNEDHPTQSNEEEKVKSESEEASIKESTDEMSSPEILDVSKEVMKCTSLEIKETTSTRCLSVTRDRVPAVFIGLERDPAVQVSVDSHCTVHCTVFVCLINFQAVCCTM